ncbi:MAG: LPS export ABC transporter periplasmic protein LptC [Candidatus Omnitrophota bacterium]
MINKAGTGSNVRNTGCKVFVVLFCFSLHITHYTLHSCYAQEQNAAGSSDQQISDFSLAGYGDKGKKAWEIAGKSADIFTEVIKLKDITGNLYGETENTRLTSQKGDFNKAEGKIHLEDNVVITTTSGAKLTTDSLDWDRKNQIVSTKDIVNIVRENMWTKACGLRGEPSLKKVNLEEDVKVEIQPQNQSQDKEAALSVNGKERIVITCDGPLEIDYEKNIAVFNNNVKVDRQESQIYADRMEIYFLKSDKKNNAERKTELSDPGASVMGNTQIDKLVCRGNVKIIRGENTSYSEEAVYSNIDKKIILSGRPRLVLYSSGDFKDASFGN